MENSIDEESKDREMTEALESKEPDRTEVDNRSNLFSSEDFKIEVQNLPRFCGHSQLKKLFSHKLKLNFHKLKPCGPKANYMYICFKNVEDKEKAIGVIDGFVYKGSKLRAKSSSKQKDPFQKKTEQTQSEAPPDERPVEERLRAAVCPLADDSYETQLSKKQSEVQALVKRLGSEVSRGHDVLRHWVGGKIKDCDTIAPVSNFVRSPSVNGYRNKCEFSIGHMTVEGQTERRVTVGFRLSSYKSGSVDVVSLSSLADISTTLPHISAKMVSVVSRLEQYVRASGVPPYCSLQRTGNWRNVMIRTSRGTHTDRVGSYEDNIREMMVVITCDPMDLSPETTERLKSELTLLFSDETSGVTSLYLHLAAARKEAGQTEAAPCLLSGSASIQETLLDRQFSISPQAFFQVNTPAAEVLYKLAGNAADLNNKTTLVDVCCGTGTIGELLAKVHSIILSPLQVSVSLTGSGMLSVSTLCPRPSETLKEMRSLTESPTVITTRGRQRTY